MTKTDKQGPNVLAERLQRNAAILSEQWEQLPVVLCSSSQIKKGKEEILSYINSILTNIKE